MTYKLNPEIEKMEAPVVIRFEDGTEQEFESGKAAAASVFDKHYNIRRYFVRDTKIVAEVYEFFEKNKK